MVSNATGTAKLSVTQARKLAAAAGSEIFVAGAAGSEIFVAGDTKDSIDSFAEEVMNREIQCVCVCVCYISRGTVLGCSTVGNRGFF